MVDDPTTPIPRPPTYDPPPESARPAHVTAAAIVLIVLGVFITLGGLLVVLGGSLIGSLRDAPGFGDQLGNIPASIGGLLAVLGLIVVAYGVLQIATGIYALLGKSWARITGMILGVIGVLFSLAAVFPGESGTAGGVIVAVVVLGSYAYAVWAFTTNGRWFAPR